MTEVICSLPSSRTNQYAGFTPRALSLEKRSQFVFFIVDLE